MFLKQSLIFIRLQVKGLLFILIEIQSLLKLDQIKYTTSLFFLMARIRLLRKLNTKDQGDTPAYLDILKKGSKYNFDDRREITKFTYKPVNDTDLINIRREFKLDSIIGTGNEVSQILSLLHWVHNSFRHDGTREAPKYSSISNLMNICIKDHKTLDCGTLASVLNNCYLALGFKSRRVVCLPKDSTDFDCHSINTVYSNTLKKWLWIDPTNDAYVMNEKGELLSIAEVRERLVKNKPLILNPEANWNHRNSITKEYYLYNYMAKNLYAFECFVPAEVKAKVTYCYLSNIKE